MLYPLPYFGGGGLFPLFVSPTYKIPTICNAILRATSYLIKVCCFIIIVGYIGVNVVYVKSVRMHVLICGFGFK